ncbi:GNAT family N-acetyltransferase [Brevibacillus formosus]|uniref:GNAT family N-acetyltransferase n=1 Tax=Brevibacillus formosus TaxID=54913 RepID=UPI001EEDD150|nr:GNAT family N-acetyltransferase [Brevibacillus formosus]MED1955593.1 GNAT family N-acetyltransferase [Brevibacillus formosus]
MISLLILRTGHEQLQLLEQISLEDSYILYGNMYLRTERSVVVTDSVQGEVTAIGSYLKGMPFHAFSLHVVEGDENYEVEPMLSYMKEVLNGSLSDGQKGVIALAEPLLTRVQIPNTIDTRTMHLMKLTDPEHLLPAGESRILELSEAQIVENMAAELGMISFRAEEVAEMPHIALFSEGGEPMAVAGFHVYDEAYVEIGNIGTSVHHRQKGLGTQISSDISRIGLEKSANVYLMVFTDNPAAMHVYEKLGFVTVSSYAFIEFLL